MNKFDFIFGKKKLIKRHKSSEKSIFEKRNLDVIPFIQEQFTKIELNDENVIKIEMNKIEHEFIKGYLKNRSDLNLSNVYNSADLLVSITHGHLFGARIDVSEKNIGITFVGGLGTRKHFV